MIWQIRLAALLVFIVQSSVAAEKERSTDDNIYFPPLIEERQDNVSFDGSRNDGYSVADDFTSHANRERSFPPIYKDYTYPQFPEDVQDTAEDPLFPPGAQPRANVEGSEIVEPAFVVPEELQGSLHLFPSPDLPRKTYALTVSDEQVTHKDIRKDNGEYVFSYTTADGSRRTEVGNLVTAANGRKVLVQRGSYAYTTRDGQMFQVDYQADTRGFRILGMKPLGGRRRVRPRPGQFRPLITPSAVTTGSRLSSALTAEAYPTFTAKESNKPGEIKPVYTPFLVQISSPVKKNKPIDIALPISSNPYRKPSKNNFSIDKHTELNIYPFSFELPT